mgnify:FL=1
MILSHGKQYPSKAGIFLSPIRDPYCIISKTFKSLVVKLVICFGFCRKVSSLQALVIGFALNSHFLVSENSSLSTTQSSYFVTQKSSENEKFFQREETTLGGI